MYLKSKYDASALLQQVCAKRASHTVEIHHTRVGGPDGHLALNQTQ